MQLVGRVGCNLGIPSSSCRLGLQLELGCMLEQLVVLGYMLEQLVALVQLEELCEHGVISKVYIKKSRRR